MIEVIRDGCDPAGCERADSGSAERLEEYAAQVRRLGKKAEKIGRVEEAIRLYDASSFLYNEALQIFNQEALEARERLRRGKGLHGEDSSKAEVMP